MRGALVRIIESLKKRPWSNRIVPVALAALFAFLAPAHAIPPAKSLALCRLDTWGLRDGLPGYDITSLAQTPDGYLWIGTTQGLLRFDGVSFTLFDRHNMPGLTDSTIRGLGIDDKGNLLVGPEWCGYGRIVNGSYVRANFPDKNWNAAHFFHYAPDGSLWIGYQGWAYVLRERNGVVQKITLPAGLYMCGIADMPGGNELICADYGALYWITKDGKVSTFDTEPAIPVSDFTCMAQMPDGSIWVGTDMHGIYRLAGRRCTHITTANGLASNTIHCLYVDSHQRLWIGTNSGIDTPSGSSFTHFGASDGLGSDNVAAILEDHEGNMWVASGIYLNRFADTRFTPVGFGKGMMSQMEQVTTAANGDIMCGTRDGLWALSTADGALPRQITHFRVDGAKTLWNGDLLVWWIRDPFSGVVGVVRSGKLIAQQIVSYNPFFVEPTPGGADVYSSFQDFQRFHWDPARKLLTAGQRHPLTAASGDLEIFDVQPAAGGALWLGTSRGLAICKNGLGRVLDIQLPAGAHVLSVDSSSPDCVWLGTDHGLGALRGPSIANPWTAPATGYTLQMYTKQDGLPSDEILQVLRDDRQSIWVGGYFGICSIPLADLAARDMPGSKPLSLRVYTAADGIRSYPCLATPVKSSNGKLWFVGQRGLTRIDPSQLISNTLAPPVQIEDAVANGKTLAIGATTHVRPGNGSLIVHYAGLSYVQPEMVNFKYRLEGFDQGWIDAGTKRVASYTNLPPGSYTFRVIACNDQRIWNKTGASIKFVLEPHFYQTMWFDAILVLIGLIVVVAIVVLRTRAVMLRAKELEAKVAHRTGELIKANGQLKDLEEELRLQNLQLKDTQASIEAQNEELHSIHAELTNQNDLLQSVQAELESQNQELLEAQDQLTAANARLEALATTDGLTGLYNHRMFHEQIEHEWTRHTRYGTAMSVILLDVDKFKLYNDTYGHPAGDDVLRKVAEILRNTARKSDFVARYGGEEFVIVARESDARSATRLAERIRAALESADWTMRPVTGSFGVATAGPMTKHVSDLVAQADSALYRSKNGGRNRVTHFEDREPAPTPASAS